MNSLVSKISNKNIKLHLIFDFDETLTKIHTANIPKLERIIVPKDLLIDPDLIRDVFLKALNENYLSIATFGDGKGMIKRTLIESIGLTECEAAKIKIIAEKSGRNRKNPHIRKAEFKQNIRDIFCTREKVTTIFMDNDINNAIKAAKDLGALPVSHDTPKSFNPSNVLVFAGRMLLPVTDTSHLHLAMKIMEEPENAKELVNNYAKEKGYYKDVKGVFEGLER